MLALILVTTVFYIVFHAAGFIFGFLITLVFCGLAKLARSLIKLVKR